jgi:hypothetical protein
LWAQTTIASFTLLSAKPRDAFTLTGAGFNTTTKNNVVFFGATKASILQSFIKPDKIPHFFLFNFIYKASNA